MRIKKRMESAEMWRLIAAILAALMAPQGADVVEVASRLT